MNRKTIFLSACVMMFSASLFAQGPDAKKVIINTSASVKVFYDLETLQSKNKRELLDLLIERLKVITYTLPNIALTTKPGVTLSEIGVPQDQKNNDALVKFQDATTTFINNSTVFTNLMMPYADKSDIISGILFYENIIKSIKTVKE